MLKALLWVVLILAQLRAQVTTLKLHDYIDNWLPLHPSDCNEYLLIGESYYQGQQFSQIGAKEKCRDLDSAAILIEPHSWEITGEPSCFTVTAV